MKKVSVIVCVMLFVLFWALPAFADETTINLDPSTPFVDVPFVVEQETLVQIETQNGTPQTNQSFIDSWLYVLDEASNILFADDDGNHSGTNVLASKIHQVLQAGSYVIRATSFGFVASGGTQFPTGSYLLTTNVILPTPTPTPSNIEPTETPSPTPTPTPTESQTPEPTPTPTVTPEPTPTETITPSPTPEPVETNEPETEGPTQEVPQSVLPEPVEIVEDIEELEQETYTEEEFVDEVNNEETVTDTSDSLTVEEIQQEALEQYNEEYEYQLDEIVPLDSVLETLTDEETLELLESLDPNQPVEYIEGVILEAGVVIVFELLDNPVQLLNEIFSDPSQAVEAFLQVGADMTKEEREESEKVIIASVIVGQITLATSVTMVSASTLTGSSGTPGRRL